MATAIHNVYPPKHVIEEELIPPIGSTGVKNVKKQMKGHTENIMVLFESAITEGKFIPKKIMGREQHVYPDVEAVGDMPYGLGDTRAATAFFRGRRHNRYHRNYFHTRCDREDRLVYPFYSMGKRSEMAEKEKEMSAVRELLDYKPLPQMLKRKRFVPVLDRMPLWFEPGYNERQKPDVSHNNVCESGMYFSQTPHQFDPHLVRSPLIRHVHVRWRGRLHERHSGQRFWPTNPDYSAPKNGKGPYNWGSFDSTAAVDEMAAMKIVEEEKSLDLLYDSQPNIIPSDVPTLFDYMPEDIQDDILYYDMLDGPIEDGMEGYYYSIEVNDEEYDRQLNQMTRGQTLDPTKVIVEDPEHKNYYTKFMNSPQPQTKTRHEPPTTDKAWIPMPGRKVLWEEDLGYNEVQSEDVVVSDFTSPDTMYHGLEEVNTH